MRRELCTQYGLVSQKEKSDFVGNANSTENYNGGNFQMLGCTDTDGNVLNNSITLTRERSSALCLHFKGPHHKQPNGSEASEENTIV